MFVNGIHVQEYAKLEYGRLLWRVPAYRERLLRHWHDVRHPHAERFAQCEAEVTRILESERIPMPRWTPNCASATPACARLLRKSRPFLGPFLNEVCLREIRRHPLQFDSRPLSPVFSLHGEDVNLLAADLWQPLNQSRCGLAAKAGNVSPSLEGDGREEGERSTN